MVLKAEQTPIMERNTRRQPSRTNPLNTQPEGTTCEDCQRFRKDECPYPGSNITMTMCNAFLYDTRRQPQQPDALAPKFNSTELILLAHDEWKRREERKHIHEEIPWVQGFINGFITQKKWAREHLDKIQRDAAENIRKQQEREKGAKHRTYESCHKRFSCPDGEECWYMSEDYYWDCGKGAAKLAEEWKRGYDAAIATIRKEAGEQ